MTNKTETNVPVATSEITTPTGLSPQIQELIQLLVTQGSATHPSMAHRFIDAGRVTVDGVIVNMKSVFTLTPKSVVIVSAIEEKVVGLVTMKCKKVIHQKTTPLSDKVEFSHGGFTLFVSVTPNTINVGDKIDVLININRTP